MRVGDTLLGGVLSPDNTTFAFTNAGYGGHHLYLLDAQTGRVRQTVPLPRAWNGIAWSPDSTSLYVSGGGSPRIHVFHRGSTGAYVAASPIVIGDLRAVPPEANGTANDTARGQAYVAGLAISRDGSTLYAANFATDTIYAISLPNGAVKARCRLKAGVHPYCVRLSPDGSMLYATLTPAKGVAVLNTGDLSLRRIIPVDSHPNDLLFAPDGRLFVSCGNSDTILALDTVTGETTERISVSLTPRSPAGATPVAMALAPDAKTLYVANADNNDVAAIDVSRVGKSRVKGFIPTGWYPSAVAVTPDGTHLLVGSGKGLGTGPSKNLKAPRKADSPEHFTYIGDLLYGLISTIPIPGDARLATYSRQVLANTPYRDAFVHEPGHAPLRGSSAVPSRLGDPSPIKYVLYIIKENHTFDQVLGDFKDQYGHRRGNGDPTLTLFGENITPNIHALARQYVLLDNLYCNGEVSGNGHPWSTGAYSTDIGERSWRLEYSGHASWALKDADLYPPAGRIWDECERKGLTYASYYYTWTTDNTHKNMPPVWLANLNKLRDFQNADLFIKDLKKYEQSNKLPNFMIMSLREDHTEGTTPGKFTPTAEVASNDLGVGKIVAACSRSKFWKRMAIFIIEDDAQDGPDHVDAHRTEGLVISPYVRRGRVDSTFYTTTSMLRTMELILGLPPMTQYDAAATPMYSLFSSRADLTPYTSLPPRVDLMARNLSTAYGARESHQMDFSQPDRLTAKQVVALNHILWHSIKGADVPYPAPTRRALPVSISEDDD
jgi:YVTN family beta-propeller protein